jgi:hypothetical protein
MNDDDRTCPVTTPPAAKLTPDREREIREQLGLADTAFETEIAAALHCSVRTVQRFELPHRVIAGHRLYDLPASAEQLRRISRTGTPTPDDVAEGSLPPAVRHRRRLEREGADAA